MDWRLVVWMILGMQACQSGDTVTGEQKEFVTDSPPADSVVAAHVSFSEEETLLLEKYFEPVLLAKLDNYVAGYDALATAADFEKNYNEGMALFAELYEALTVPKTGYLKAKFEELGQEDENFYPVDLLSEYDGLNGMLGPVMISCAAECTDLDFLYDLEAMLEKAKATSGNADEDFMELVLYIENNTAGYAAYPGFKVWYVQTWDYGGYSMLGNGVFTDAVKRTMAFEKEHNLFAAQIAAIHGDFINSLTWDTSFGLSKEDVLKEFDALMKTGFFTKEEKEVLKESREKIQNGAEGYQFDCETGDCSYG
jgi:hypothetical protein